MSAGLLGFVTAWRMKRALKDVGSRPVYMGLTHNHAASKTSLLGSIETKTEPDWALRAFRDVAASEDSGERAHRRAHPRGRVRRLLVPNLFEQAGCRTPPTTFKVLSSNTASVLAKVPSASSSRPGSGPGGGADPEQTVGKQKQPFQCERANRGS